MKYLLLLLSTTALLALTPTQQQLLDKAYRAGEPYNLGETLRAITMVESSAGINKRNKYVMACGATQILVKSFKTRYKDILIPENLTDEQVCQMLIADDELALVAALEELLWWRNVHKGNWQHTVQSYNAGYNWNSVAGSKYLSKVRHFIKYFSRHK